MSRVRRSGAVRRLALALPVGSAVVAAAAWAAVPGYYLPPSGAPYRAEEIRIRSGGEISLGGTFTTPDNGKRRHPVVVLISGAAAEDRDATAPGSPYRPFYEIADTLARRGIAALRLDDRGVGSSTGSLATATTFDRSLDVRAALDYLRRRPDADPLRLGLLGVGEGATIAVMIAEADSAARALVLMAPPASNGRSIVEWQERREAIRATELPARRDSLYRAAMSQWEQKANDDPWTRFYATYDPIAAAEQVRAPVLILQGTADETMPAEGPSTLAAAFRRSGGSDVTVRLFDQLEHTFLDPRGLPPQVDAPPAAYRLPGLVLGTVADWVSTHLPRRADPPVAAKKVLPKKRRSRR